MEILSVALKNFKSHSDREFIFQPGTNAICGENGAGKTSILEAIAWVLFDYIGDYTKDDLIRNGAASAQVRVAFVSNRDGRTYEVQRCTTKSYTLYDPQLSERLPYSRIKEEVLPWLRQHLGVAPGTDLGQLFSSTIGVPQGTFTADFLLTRERRKPIFDKILKVEEYQQTWKKLADLEKFAKAQVETLERDLARYEEELQDFDDYQTKRQQQQQEIDRVQAELQQVQIRFTELQQQLDALMVLAQRSQQIETQLHQLSTQSQTQTKNLERLQDDLKQAEDAVTICTAERPAFQAYQNAEETLRELEKRRLSEQTLQKQKRQQEAKLNSFQTELTSLTLQLNRLSEARQEIERLEPFAQEQRRLEQLQQSINQQLQAFQSIRQAVKEQEKRSHQLQTRQTQLSQEIADVQTLATAVQEIPSLEQQQQRLQQQLSRVAAAKQFEADLRRLFEQAQASGSQFVTQVEQAEAIVKNLQQAVPPWSQPLESLLTILANGANLQQQTTVAIHAILADLAEQTSPQKLEQQLHTLQGTLKLARQSQTRFANLERLVADHAHLATEAADLQKSLNALQTQLLEEKPLQAKYTQITAELTALENPLAQIQLWQKELQQEANLLQKVEAVKTTSRTVEAAIAQLDQQLEAFATLTEDMLQQQAIRDEHKDAYERYMANREMANSRKQRLQLVQEVTDELKALDATKATLTEELNQIQQTFDPLQFQTIQAAHKQANDQQVALNARLPDMVKHLESLDRHLERLEGVRTKQRETKAELEQKKKAEKFIKFARKAYKEAGPRITERYIQSISREADKLFRELLNRPNVSLQWTRDYEIVVQEGAHSRRLINLSGGEQMCAALAVRLALLKVLADIDIAFFDEPTTNMDRPRREQLADAIANIKTFRQLFVISHDDTFEKVTENIIVVERDE